MKVFTNTNNTSTLKLLIAAKLAGKKVQIKNASFADNIFTGPRQLPYLQVNEDLNFFSSNAAMQYLLPILDLSENGQCEQILDWEATRLYPTVYSAVSTKTIPSDLKQYLTVLLADIDSKLSKNKFILGDKLTPADICIWSTIYPLTHKESLKSTFLNDFNPTIRWSEQLASAKAFKEAVTEWGGSADGPFGPTSVLGVPLVPNLTATLECQEEPIALGPTSDEIKAAQDYWLSGKSNLQPLLVREKIILPLKDRKNILITSSLPYVNNVPHLGNIIGCVLSADIFARYGRLCDYNILYVSGTDEYGTATETKAIEMKLTPKQVCDKYYEIHNDVYRWFNIGFDYFGRTSTTEHTEITHHIFKKLHENGFISEQTVDQLLCQQCNRFLADRFVEGICPHLGCGYEDARGDQCDKCGKLVTATELIEPRCKSCGAKPVLTPSKQMFLQLDELEGPVRAWFVKHDSDWSSAARGVARAWLRDGLRPRCITRDLTWGVPVPAAGDYKSKVFYVWFDAPIGYMSITHTCTKDYKKWWRPDKGYEVKLYQFMAKDNVPFHAVMFPATMLGANDGYILVDNLFATEYLNYEEGKFSKSRGVGVFGTDAQETGIPSDVWRFYLASIRPESSDSSFSWSELGTRNNSELLNNLGNFCHRSLSFCANTFKCKIPDMELRPSDYEIIALINREISAYVHEMERGRLRDSLKRILNISRIGNQYMQSEQPWVLLKGTDDNKTHGATAVGLCCQIVALLCTLLAPYMPDTSITLGQQLNVDKSELRINPDKPFFFQYLKSGHEINKPKPLFTKIENDRLEELKKKYAGTQSDRANSAPKA